MQVVDNHGVSSRHHRDSHGLQFIDDCVASIDTTDTVTTYHRDRQFNTIGLTDSTGAITNLASYTPYGDFTVTDASGTDVDASTVDNEYWYTGRRLDKESGLWYFRARYFDSAMGGFISRDPLGFVDGQTLYAGYFAMRLATDPSGLGWGQKCCEFACVGALGVLGLVSATICVIGEPATFGGITLPCVVWLGAIAGGIAGTSTLCDELCTNNPDADWSEGLGNFDPEGA